MIAFQLGTLFVLAVGLYLAITGARERRKYIAANARAPLAMENEPEAALKLPVEMLLPNTRVRVLVSIDFNKLPRSPRATPREYAAWAKQIVDQVKEHYSDLKPGEPFVYGDAMTVSNVFEPIIPEPPIVEWKASM